MEFEGRFIDIMEVFNVDKYEFNIKLEQIKKLAAKKEYKQAAEIAKQMNWNKVKESLKKRSLPMRFRKEI